MVKRFLASTWPLALCVTAIAVFVLAVVMSVIAEVQQGIPPEPAVSCSVGHADQCWCRFRAGNSSWAPREVCNEQKRR